MVGLSQPILTDFFVANTQIPVLKGLTVQEGKQTAKLLQSTKWCERKHRACGEAQGRVDKAGEGNQKRLPGGGDISAAI